MAGYTLFTRFIRGASGVTSDRHHTSFACAPLPLTNDTQSFVRQSRKIGFTLAEVLITLGIIGIVAAMTMPTLIQKYKKQEYSTRLKKFNSLMAQAALMYNAENNTTNADWVLPSGGADNVEVFWNTYYAPYFKNIVKTKKSGIYYNVYFSEGTRLQMYKGGVVIDVFLDINGDKGPNKEAIDKYHFLMGRGTFEPFTWLEWDTITNINDRLPEGETPVTRNFKNRDNVLRFCKYGSKSFCGQLLKLDGWEFKDDYPYKL